MLISPGLDHSADLRLFDFNFINDHDQQSLPLRFERVAGLFISLATKQQLMSPRGLDVRQPVYKRTRLTLFYIYHEGGLKYPVT